jgi:hypothetical protein
MREHCARGYHMLRKIPFLAESAEIVFSHQEHFDGSGYPNGLRGSRDSHRRPHLRRRRHPGRHHQRPPLPQGAQLRRRRAKRFCAAPEPQFDPASSRSSSRVPNELWHELRSEITGQNKRFSTFDESWLCPAGHFL